MSVNPRAQKILDYWFGDLDYGTDYLHRQNTLWFGGGDAVDGQIRALFEADLIRASTSPLPAEFAAWKSNAKECLALIVLLDQFSLNLYREQPKSYDTSALAIPLAKHMVHAGWDWCLSPVERVFVYLPLEHAENIPDQELSVSLFQKLADGAAEPYREAMEGYLDYAKRHHRVVAKYGRFPDRNEVYGRASTPEELKFLASDDAPF